MAQKGYIKNSLTKDLGAPEMANMFQGIFGASGIMSLYENLACVKVDNNTVRMSAGAYNLSGHLLGIAKGTTEDLTIDSGTSGQNRNDLIVAEFVRNGGGLGVDTLHFAVVKGISTSGTAADPALTQQDINAAGVTRQEALYRVKVTGTEITAVEKVAGSVSNLNLVQSGGPSGAFTNMPFVGTAPIVESGSNTNGSWIKFADRTMFQWNNNLNKVTLDGGGTWGWPLPSLFINTNYFAFASLREYEVLYMQVPIIEAFTTSQAIFVQRPIPSNGTPAGTPVKVQAFAIGKW